MGEALVSRAGGSDTSLPIDPTQHLYLITLETADGKRITNCILNVKDGSSYYNYTTNQSGQVTIGIKGGNLNMLVPNVIDGIQYHDILNTWINKAAPLGESEKLNIIHNNSGNLFYNKNTLFNFISSRKVFMVLEGGGGAGSGATCSNRVWYRYNGAGGGSGYVKTYNTTLAANKYNFICGLGGQNGFWDRTDSGGISYLVGTSYSANGGSGASMSSPGTGYRSGERYAKNGTASGKHYTITYGMNGGAGYFGDKGIGMIQHGDDESDWWDSPTSGSNGAGGGGAYGAGTATNDMIGASGSNGFIMINFIR